MHLLGCCFAAPKELHGSESLECVKEMRAHSTQSLPVPFRLRSRHHARDSQEEEQDGDHYEQENAGRDINTEDGNDNDSRDNGCQNNLRVVLAEIGVEGFNSIAQCVYQFAAALITCIKRAEQKKMLEQAPAHFLFYLPGELVRGQYVSPREESSERDNAGQNKQQAPYLFQRLRAEKDIVDDLAQIICLQNNQATQKRSTKYGNNQIETRSGYLAQKPHAKSHTTPVSRKSKCPTAMKRTRMVGSKGVVLAALFHVTHQRIHQWHA